MKQYTPLHIHSDYSSGDSILHIDDYVGWAKKNEFNSIALTDHGNMSGTFYFNLEANKAGIKPIIGIEAYCMYDKEFEICKDEDAKTKPHRDHLIIIAKNKKGYHELLKLLGNSMRETYYSRPIITYEALYKANKGNFIISAACMGGRIQNNVILGNEAEATRFSIEMHDEFKDDFYFEAIENDIDDQRKANEWFFLNSKRLGIKTIFTTDSHYLLPEHNKAHDILKLNQSKRTFEENTKIVKEEGDRKNSLYTARHLSLKTREQIIEECKAKQYDIKKVNEALDNTFEIDSKCEKYTVKSDTVYMPKFSDNSFKELCDRAKKALIDKKLNKTSYVERLKHELKVIKLKKMEDYFLIVADIIDFANRNNIFVGAGRGSGGGSLVVYLLGITKIDPLKYDLLFERMLNAQRVDPPDIDLDFESRGRPAIEEYLKEKYGIKSVSHIISFGRFGIKGALRDTFKAYYGARYRFELEGVTKFINDEDEDFELSLSNATKLGGSVVEKFIKQHRDTIDVAKALVGRNRHYSLHAGGVVISNGDLENYIPVMRLDDNIVAGIMEGADHRLVTDAGLMKFDILGLNACSVLQDALELLKDKVTFEDIINDDNNKDVLRQFQVGNTFGCFQFEGKNITKFVKQVYPESFDDLVAINALYRPAVIIAHGLDNYLANRKRFDKNTSDPFQKILKDTYGVPVYQEQIMEIFHKLGNMTLEEADDARHILKLLFKGKDDYTDFNKLMAKFKEGCHKTTNYNDEEIEKIMDIVKQFSSYSFNKSHSCAYAMMGYAMQYLKILYPHEYFSALLSNTDNVDSRQDKVEVNLLRDYIINIYSSTGIRVIRPDVNTSDAEKFKIVGNDLLFPLSKIKGVGIDSAKEIVSKQPFTSFNDLITRIDKKKANKRVIRALVKSGALKFDDTYTGFEKQYKEAIEKCTPKSSFETMNILFDGEFKALFPGYNWTLKELKGKKLQGTTLYGFIYKLRPIITKSGRKINFVSLYDGTEILDNCKTKSLEGLEEGVIIKCKATLEAAYNKEYTSNIYVLENIEEIKGETKKEVVKGEGK